MDGVGAGGGKTAAGWRFYRQSVRRPGGVGTLPAVTIPCTHRGNASGARAGIGTGASQRAQRGSNGADGRRIRRPFLCADACIARPARMWPCCRKDEAPTLAGASSFVGADVRQGRNRGDPDFPTDIDMEGFR